jgi:hypothetical protein
MAATRNRFFVGMSIVFLLVVLAGFSRTFFLRAFFDVPPIPLLVYVHGAILTGWFVWFCVQTSLVAAGRSDVHRRMGILGALLGVAVILANAWVVAAAGPRLRVVLQSGEFDPDFIVAAIWGDIGSLLTFAVLLCAALLLRHRPAAHKRLMFLASASILGPALARVGIIAGTNPMHVSTGGQMVFLGILVIYDLWTIRGVHPATAVGVGLRVLMWFAVAAVAASGFGKEVVYGLAASGGEW